MLGLGLAALLAVLGMGYIIRLKAEDAKGQLRTLGIVIAYIIIIVSILAAACLTYHSHVNILGGRPYHKSMMMPCR